MAKTATPPKIEAVGEESMASMRESARQEAKQQQMEKELYGKPVFPPSGTQTLPGKPSDKDKKPQTLPGKPSDKDKKLGEGASKYRTGGYVRAADGCVQRGKTRGRMV